MAFQATDDLRACEPRRLSQGIHPVPFASVSPSTVAPSPASKIVCHCARVAGAPGAPIPLQRLANSSGEIGTFSGRSRRRQAFRMPQGKVAGIEERGWPAPEDHGCLLPGTTRATWCQRQPEAGHQHRSPVRGNRRCRAALQVTPCRMDHVRENTCGERKPDATGQPTQEFAIFLANSVSFDDAHGLFKPSEFARERWRILSRLTVPNAFGGKLLLENR